jgi:hypothetical protein
MYFGPLYIKEILLNKDWRAVGVVKTPDASNISRGDPDPEVPIGQVTDNGEKVLLVCPLGQKLAVNLHESGKLK